jgi:hypothetical protein
LYSPVFDLSTVPGADVSYWCRYTNDMGTTPGFGYWRVQVTDDGVQWVDLEYSNSNHRDWAPRSFVVSDYIELSSQVQFRFQAEDTVGMIVEAGVDDFLIDMGTNLVDAAPPEVLAIYPNGGELVAFADSTTLTWSAQDDIGVVQAEVEVSVDGGSDWLPAAAGPLNGVARIAWADVLPPGSEHDVMALWRVKVIDGAMNEAVDQSDGTFVVQGQASVATGVPLVAGLAQNRPNPFNPRTTIAFDLTSPHDVTLQVFDLSGRLVRILLDNEHVGSGRREVVWNACDDAGRQLASGAYFYRLDAGGRVETKRMMLVR